MEPVAYVIVTDGSRRPVFDDGQQQWIEGENGEREYGVWYVPREECDTPIVICRPASDGKRPPTGSG